MTTTPDAQPPTLHFIEAATGPEPAWTMIWLHGLGASGDDFVPVVRELHRPRWPTLRYLFPHAPVRPVTLNGGMPMRAWYDIVNLGADDLSQRADMAGVADSVARVDALIAREQARGIPAERILLAGFSQGGAIALSLALRRKAPLAGIVAFSTYLPGLDAGMAALVADAATQPVFMAHGSADPVVPMFAGEQSCALLRKAGFAVDWRTYAMAHHTCPEEIDQLGDWMQALFARADA